MKIQFSISRMFIARSLSDVLHARASEYPIVAITGPRQSGKTTLARATFPDRPYVSLEDLDQRQFAQEDPRGFLGRFRGGAILDEVQRTPDLFSYLQSEVDDNPAPGRFVLTGSHRFGLLTGISQSLAGRAAMFSLLPFSLGELAATDLAPDSLNHLLFGGLYPPVHDRRLDPGPWYANYNRTYVERDVRQLVNVRDLTTFQRFVALCAGRSGQLLNLSALASDAGVSHTTARGWLSILEAGYIVHLVKPHHANFNKRLVKTPKLYFIDTGLACRLLGLEEADQLDSHPLRGALFETWVAGELLKSRLNRGLESSLFFWRDRAGHEVDFILDTPAGLMPIEVKAGMTIASDALKPLRWWEEQATTTTLPGALIYGGEDCFSRQGTTVAGWQHIDQISPV